MSFNINDWNTYSNFYDALNYLHPYQAMYGDIVSQISKTRPGFILDAATGTGNLAQYCNALPWASSLHITGIDISEKMLEIAKSKTTNTQSSYHTQSLDSKFCFSSEIFDMVVSVSTLYATSSPLRTLEEFYRVLKPGGTLLLVTPLTHSHPGLVLKGHAQAINHRFALQEDRFWTKDRSEEETASLVRSVITDDETAQKMLYIASHNKRIYNTNKFTFYTQGGYERLIQRTMFIGNTFTRTYAQQSILHIGEKSAH